MGTRILRAFCARMDHGGCGLRVQIENGRVTRIEGDPHSPLSRGYVCAKGKAHPERLNHPDRLTYPLLRNGRRGEGNWKRISWDQALTRLVEAIQTTQRQRGSECICFGQGTPKGIELYLMIRLANVLGIPNITTPGSVCHMPRETASVMTCGFYPLPDYDHSPSCVLVWGSNLLSTNEEGVLGISLKAAVDRGATLVVIDPRRTKLAAMADLWIRPKPGTDLALALGMIKVLVEEDLYDRSFVEKWVQGFDELRDHLRAYDLAKVSQTTWVPKDQILEGARIYGTAKPACLQWGNALENTHQSFQTARGLLALMAISGNLGTTGGNVQRADPPLMKLGELVLSKTFPEKRERMISSQFRVATMMGFVPSQLIVENILADETPRIRMMYLQGTNPLLSYPDAQRTQEALRRLDFLAISEIFLTPSAQLADLVLPAATTFEFDDIGHYGLRHGFILARPKIVDPPGECWPDAKILNELGRRLGHAESFWEDIRACLDEIVAPSGLSYESFAKLGMLKGKWESKDPESGSFGTPSGKIEIYCQRLKDLGYDPLPTYRENINGTDPLAPSDDFPLILTSCKDPFCFHSSNRNLPSLRRLSPDPTVTIHPKTAERLGLTEGDWAFVGTARGTIRQKIHLSGDLDPRVIVASFGWWFPDEKDSELSGWRESNLNVLTSNRPPYDPAIGTPLLRGIPCRVWSEQNSRQPGEANHGKQERNS